MGYQSTDLECPQSWDSHTSSISNKYSGKFQFRWASGHKDATAGRFVTSSYIHMFWDKFMQKPNRLTVFHCKFSLALPPWNVCHEILWGQHCPPSSNSIHILIPPQRIHPFLRPKKPQVRWGRCPVVSYPNLGSTNPGCQWKMKVYRSIEFLIGIWQEDQLISTPDISIYLEHPWTKQVHFQK